LGQRKPNIKALVRREDVDGLERAASYQEVERTRQGTVRDLGIPVRAEAILALGSLETAGHNMALARGLRDPADLVRCAAVRALQARGEAGLLVQALKWLPANHGHSRKLASQAVLDLKNFVTAPDMADALVNRDDEELLSEDDAALVNALLDEDRPIPFVYAGFRGEGDELIKRLVTALGDGRGIVADRAGELLLRLAPISIDAVVAELRKGKAAAEAACLLGRIADRQALDPLVNALRHRDPRVRAQSAAALGELQDPASVEPLVQATRDRDDGVRTQARLALDRLGTTAAIAGVTGVLEPMIREAVEAAVGDPEAEEQGRTGGSRKPARRQTRARRSNGRSPKATKGGAPEAPDATSTPESQRQ
jgi:HEAT repeat protein